MKIRAIPFHPFLIAAFQILAIYAANINIVNTNAFVVVLLIVIFSAAIVYLILSITTKDTERVALVVSCFIFLFFSYGRLYEAFTTLSITKSIIGINRYLIPLYGLTLIGAIFFIFRSTWCRIHLKALTSFFNRFSIILVLVAISFAIINFDWSVYQIKRMPSSINGINDSQLPFAYRNRESRLKQPNVYFVVLDSYGSHRILHKYFDHDDTSLVNGLKRYGFVINTEAHSNYPFTVLSLGSMLNMSYIHEKPEFIRAKSKEAYLNQVIIDNKVFQRFRLAGYDVVLNQGGVSIFSEPFVVLVINVTILRIIENELTVDQLRQQDMATFKYLKNVAISHHPTFYYSYIQCPHPPYIFNPDGSKPQLAENDINVIKNPKGYINQIRFVGSQIIEIVKILKERDPNAVIIVQADHGAGWCFYDDLYISEPSNKNRNFIEIQYGVLSAISTPSGVAIPKNVTPVNLFRYLFNSLFNDQFKILPDKIYFTPIKEPYKFYNVTNIYNSVKRKN